MTQRYKISKTKHEKYFFSQKFVRNEKDATFVPRDGAVGVFLI